MGKIADWFYRVEYQQKGSPHTHMLIWLENAPKFSEDWDCDVTSFIDKIITCEKPAENSELAALHQTGKFIAILTLVERNPKVYVVLITHSHL